MDITTGNCPYTQDRLYKAIESMHAIRMQQDCLIELDRLNTPDKETFLDDLATAVAAAAMAYERLKGGKIGYCQDMRSGIR